jgi:NAD(P)H dehydrogenase (quinone)
MAIYTQMFHHGMVQVGLPYAAAGQMRMDEITGPSPYGVTTLARSDGKRIPSENELELARWQGRHVAQIAARLAAGSAAAGQGERAAAAA